MEIYSINLKEPLPENKFNTLLPYAGTEKIKRISEVGNYTGKVCTLIGRLLVRYAISSVHNLRDEDLEFSANEYGKPYLPAYPDIEFNLSHSGRYILCAVHSLPVGIDVERVHEVNPKIAKRFFKTDEIDYIEKYGDRGKAFLKIWTMKESFIKMKGEGLRIPLNSFGVFEETQKGRAYFNEIDCGIDAVCHVCAPQKSEFGFHEVTVGELEKHFIC